MVLYEDSDGSSSEGLDDDPLAKLMRMVEEQDHAMAHPAQDVLQSTSISTSSSRLDRSPKGPLSDLRGDKRDKLEDSLGRIAGVGDQSHIYDDSDRDSDGDEEEIDRDIVARIVAMRLTAIDRGDDGKELKNSNHEDPLERIRRMEEEEERKQTMAQRKVEAKQQRQQKQQQKQQSVPKSNKSSEPEESEEDAAGKELVKRIIAMRLAAIDEEDNNSVHSTPEDPLVRIMNMNAEDTLFSVISLMQYTEPENGSNEEEDTIIRERDFYDLNNMIQKNDLEELEKCAATLAESVKTKLSASTLADLTCDSETTIDHSGVGYFALAMGGHKDIVNQSHMMNGLDISKITNDEDEESDRRFVSMSDSILDSPSRVKKKQGLLGELSSDDTIHSLEQDNGFISRYIGKSTQREDGRTSLTLNGNGKEERLEIAWTPFSPKKKSSSKEGDASFHSKACLVSDWWGVIGDFAGIRSSSGEWSDSQSSMSYATTESITTDSIASLNISMQGLQTAVVDGASTLEVKIVPTGHETWDEKEEKVDLNTSSISVLEEKRKRKRELEAWRLSLARSFHKVS